MSKMKEEKKMTYDPLASEIDGFSENCYTLAIHNLWVMNFICKVTLLYANAWCS